MLELFEHIVVAVASVFAVVQGIVSFVKWVQTLRIAEEAACEREEEQHPEAVCGQGRNLDKYRFSGEHDKVYGKGRLVAEVVRRYIAGNQDCQALGLRTVFPDEWQGRYVVRLLSDREFIGEKKFEHDFYAKEDELIKLRSGEVVAVCSQWGRSNFDRFLAGVESLGFRIETIRRN